MGEILAWVLVICNCFIFQEGIECLIKLEIIQLNEYLPGYHLSYFRNKLMPLLLTHDLDVFGRTGDFVTYSVWTACKPLSTTAQKGESGRQQTY
jgi:hypothetical protein